MEAQAMLRFEIISDERMTRVMHHKWFPDILSGVDTVHGSISKPSSPGF